VSVFLFLSAGQAEDECGRDEHADCEGDRRIPEAMTVKVPNQFVSIVPWVGVGVFAQSREEDGHDEDFTGSFHGPF